MPRPRGGGGGGPAPQMLTPPPPPSHPLIHPLYSSLATSAPHPAAWQGWRKPQGHFPLFHPKTAPAHPKNCSLCPPPLRLLLCALVFLGSHLPAAFSSPDHSVCILGCSKALGVSLGVSLHPPVCILGHRVAFGVPRLPQCAFGDILDSSVCFLGHPKPHRTAQTPPFCLSALSDHSLAARPTEQPELAREMRGHVPQVPPVSPGTQVKAPRGEFTSFNPGREE